MNQPNPWAMARAMPAHLLDQWWAFYQRRNKRIQANSEPRSGKL